MDKIVDNASHIYKKTKTLYPFGGAHVSGEDQVEGPKNGP